jgi:hypothetical protein
MLPAVLLIIAGVILVIVLAVVLHHLELTFLDYLSILSPVV